MATLRKINNINTSELIDEGIILWFPGPESYTGEDMAEIHVHGGKAVVLAVQKEISKIKNCSFKNDIKENCKNSDLVILLTEWDEFKSIDFKKIIKHKRIKVFDLRNLYNAEEMKKRKIDYYSIGRPNTN